VRRDKDILAMADKFVFLRIVRMNGVDLNIFRYDYDLTWMAFFLNADGRVYARYGGRDPDSAEARVSKDGLLHAMESVLKLHTEAQAKKEPTKPLPPPKKPEDFPMLKGFAGGACIRCHMINEAYNMDAARKGPVKLDERTESFFAFPRPENLGLKPDLVLGNRIKEIEAKSAAETAGLKKDDVLRKVHGLPIVTAFDIQHALNEVGTAKEVAMDVERDGKPLTVKVALAEGWKRSDVSWRRSLWNARPSPGFGGAELEAAEKKKRGMPEDALGFHAIFIAPNGPLGRAGLKSGDVIVGVDGKRKIPYAHFKGYFPLTHQVGDTIELIYTRDKGPEQKATITWR
jgi:serine protease Do